MIDDYVTKHCFNINYVVEPTNNAIKIPMFNPLLIKLETVSTVINAIIRIGLWLFYDEHQNIFFIKTLHILFIKKVVLEFS